jgi:thioredoxin-like negative regulator of GroEL
MTVTEIGSHAAFKSFVAGHAVAVVDCYAPWCGPCKQLAPAYDRLAGKLGSAKVAFAKVDIEKVGEVATILQVSSIPMIAVFTHGKISDKIQGANLTQIESVVRFREAHL